jgi:V/A-type H+-transporting ATPase subunit C
MNLSVISDLLGEFPEFLSVAPVEVLAAVSFILFLLILFLVKFIGYFRIVLNIAHFTYPNALVTVKGNPCLMPECIDSIAESKNILEVVDEARRMGLDLGIGDTSTVEEVEKALETFYYNECNTIREIAPDSVKAFFQAYCMWEESEELKRAIRGKHAGLTPGEIEASLIPVGLLSTDLIQKMADSQSIDDLISLFQHTPYEKVLSPSLQTYHQVHATIVFELTLDRFILEELQSALSRIDASHLPSATAFVGTFADITNIKTLLRAKKDLLGAEAIEQYLLPAGSQVSSSRLRQMAESKNLREMLGELEGMGLYHGLDAAISSYNESGSLIALENKLDERLLENVLDLAMVYRYGPGPLIGFLVARKFEIQNLRAIIWGINEGIPPETIKSMAIFERVGG